MARMVPCIIRAMTNWILRGKVPVLEPDWMAWGLWFHSNDRQVAYDEFDGVEVSTIFFGLDAHDGKERTPLLFETMIFGIEGTMGPYRYATWKEAERGHAEAVKMLRG